jgi:glucan phosphoethanolaminetransferase (alkaline phosphatase superfamily)
MFSVLLISATIGLLWYPAAPSRFWPSGEPTSRIFPDWIASGAGGWYPDVIEQAANLWLRTKAGFAIYAAAQLFCLLAFFVIPFIANTLLRVLLSVLLCVGVGYDLVMFEIGGQIPNYETTETILGNVRVGLYGTISAYLVNVLPSAGFVMAAMVAFIWKPPEVRGNLQIAATAVAGLLVAIILVRTNGYTFAFPSPVTSYINAYKSFRNSADQPIEAVVYTGPLRRQFEKIVLIMDESVRGDFISLNDASIGTTPSLLSKADRIQNFGIASAGANCSTPARLIVRFGTRPAELGQPWKALRRHTSFWLYARHAGFETVHIDAQGSVNSYDSGMTPTEASSIDRRIVVNEAPLYLRDAVVAAQLRKVLREPGAKFILADKLGVHVPYDKMYPPHAADFPVTAAAFSLLDRATLVNHYRNAIRWSVDHFFEILLADGLPANTLLLYTSDHGQSLAATASRMSHCSTGTAATRSEAMVPLFTISTNEVWARALMESAILNFDRASHFELFPTLLSAMGYDRAWTDEKFGASLMGSIVRGDERRFWAGGRIVPFDW